MIIVFTQVLFLIVALAFGGVACLIRGADRRKRHEAGANRLLAVGGILVGVVLAIPTVLASAVR